MSRARNLHAHLRDAKREMNRRKKMQSMFYPAMSAAAPFVTPFGAGVLGGYGGWKSASAQEAMLEAERFLPIHPAYQFQTPEPFSHNPNLYLGHGVDFQDYRLLTDIAESKRGTMDKSARKAVRAAVQKRSMPIYLQDDMATRHMFLGGSTGTGKSVLMKSLGYQQIGRGGPLICFDAKGSSELMEDFYAMAKEYGRISDLRFFDLNKPSLSHSYNPLLGGNVREAISTVMKLYGDKDGNNEYFYRATREGLTMAMLILRNIPNLGGVTFADLSVIFSDPGVLFDLYERMPECEDKKVVFQYVLGWTMVNNDGDRVFNTRKYGEVLNGLKTMLTDFVHSEWKQLVNVYDPEIDLIDCILNNRIVVVSVPAMSDSETAETFGRLFMADFSRAVGQMARSGLRPIVPCLALLDEYPSIAHSSQVTMWAQARSQNIILAPSAQSDAFLSNVAEYFRERLMGNMWTHIYFNIRDESTQEAAVKIAGTTITRFAQDGKNQNFGTSYDNWQSGLLNKESHGEGISTGYREMREDLVRPEDFMMERGEIMMFGSHGSYRLQAPMLEYQSPIAKIDQIEIPRPERHGEQRETMLDEVYRERGKTTSLELKRGG